MSGGVCAYMLANEKNMNNGESKLFAKAGDARLCPVLAALRIVLHYERIGSADCVLGISMKGYLTDRVITKELRLAAAVVLGDEFRMRSCSNILFI